MDKIKEVKQRVGRLAEDKGLALNAISLMLGKSGTYLHKFVNYDSPKRLPEDIREKLARILEVDEQELTDRIIGSSGKRKYFFTPAVTEALKGISVGDIKYKPGLFPIEPQILEQYNIEPDNLRIMYAPDNTMAPTICLNEIIGIDTSINSVKNDGVYLVNVTGTLILRRFTFDRINNRVISSSDSSMGMAFPVENLENVKIVGKIIAVLKMIG